MYPDSISPGALKTEDEHRRDICAVGRWIHDRGYVASTDGNISLRLDPHHVLTSPTGLCKGMMTPDDLVVTDLEGKKVNGRRNPSSELGMHLLVYRRRPDINAVCHAHPPVATGYAAAGIPLNKACLRIGAFAGMRSGGSLRYPGNIRVDRSDRAIGGRLRRDPNGEPRSGDLRPGSVEGFFPNGNYRAFRARRARHTDVG